jgi:hypothetical protein
MWNNGEIDGNYKVYKLNNDDIDNVKVNKSEKLTDQQDNKRRPRFDIRLKIIQPLNLQPVFVGKI